MRNKFARDNSAAVEDIPFRLLIMVLLLAGSITIASSGLSTISGLNMQAKLTDEMDHLGEIALATSSSGSGTKVHHTLDIPNTNAVSVSELIIGGAIGETSGPFSSTYRIELSNGKAMFGTLSPGHHELNITNSDGDGPFTTEMNGGRVSVLLVAVNCQNQNLIVMMGNEDESAFDIDDFVRDNC